MAFYRICPYCHAHLDPGEVCDCQLDREHKEREQRKTEAESVRMLEVEKSGQLRLAI